MLRKSRGSAILLSAGGVAAFTATSAILNMLIPYLATGDFRLAVADPERLSRAADLIALGVILLVVFLLLTAIGAYWLYRFFGEAYYGGRGAARWALFGSIFALLIKAPGWFLPPGWWLAKNLFLGLSVFLAFFLARWIIPLQRNRSGVS
jgi:membrane protein implicated in regulation of membrane protease activity